MTSLAWRKLWFWRKGVGREGCPRAVADKGRRPLSSRQWLHFTVSTAKCCFSAVRLPLQESPGSSWALFVLKGGGLSFLRFLEFWYHFSCTWHFCSGKTEVCAYWTKREIWWGSAPGAHRLLCVQSMRHTGDSHVLETGMSTLSDFFGSLGADLEPCSTVRVGEILLHLGKNQSRIVPTAVWLFPYTPRCAGVMNTSSPSSLILIGHFVAKGTCSHENWLSENRELQQVFIKCLKPGPRKRYQDAPCQVLFHVFDIIKTLCFQHSYWFFTY